MLSNDEAIHISSTKMTTFHHACEAAGNLAGVEAVIDSFAEELALDVPAESAPPERRSTLLWELKQTLTSMRPVPPEISQARLAVCRGCEHAKQLWKPTVANGHEPGLRCAKCGCLMNAKARLAGGACPIGKFE